MHQRGPQQLQRSEHQQRQYGQPMPNQPLRSRVVTVRTNCFAVTTLPTREYHQYDVSFNPDVDIPRKRQEIIYKLQNEVAPQVFAPRAVYDGSKLLYVMHYLQFVTGGPSARFIVSLSNRTKLGEPGVFEVKVAKTIGDPIRPALDLANLLKHGQGNPRSAAATNLLQLLIRQDSNQNNPNNNRAYFSDIGKRRMENSGLELWRGYFQSVRPTIGRVLVNIDTTMAAMYQPGFLIDAMLDHLGKRDIRGLCLESTHPDFRRLDKFFGKVRINVSTIGNGKKTKAIRSFVPRAGNFIFDKDGVEITVAEYYKRVHSIHIKYPEIVGVCLTGPKAPSPVIVPAEVCTIIPGQIYKKRLPDHLTRDVVRFATLRPEERLNMISGSSGHQLSPILGYSGSTAIIESGMVIDKTPIDISGRLLEAPSLQFQGQNLVVPRDGVWNVVGQQFSQAASLVDWAVLNFVGPSLRPPPEHHIMELIKCCEKLGMNIARPVVVAEGSGQNVLASLTRTYNDAMRILSSSGNNSPKLNLLLVFLPTKALEIRTQVKYWGDIVHGIPTQCAREDNLRTKATNQYWNNIALKLNARLAGYNSLVKSPTFNEFQRSPFMIMGADVAHPAPGAHKPSVTSLVWSYDQKGAQYAAFTRVQPPRQEIIEDLGGMVGTAVDMFGKKNKCAPARIILYRDGVSDGEFENVGRFEIKAVSDAIDEIWIRRKITAAKPQLTFIVVGKRHHIVFFAPPRSDVGDKSGNVKAGFATGANQLANPLVQDFYLQSHAAIQGTSRSSHYIVLKDDVFRNDLARLQEFSYALCHVYTKATRSVSIPAPVYYADLACARGAFHVRPDCDLRFSDDSTNASGQSGSSNDFMELWRKEFKQVKIKMLESMYFL